MINGYLWYNTDEGRYGIIDSSDLLVYDGLHCGACMDVFVEESQKWVPVRLEYASPSARVLSRGWYLVGLNAAKLDGLKIRMS